LAVNDTETYRSQRSGFEAGRQMAYVEFDKSVLTISGAGLALSISFIRAVIPPAAGGLMPILYASWSLYALSMIATLLSFPLGQAAFDREIKLLDDYYKRHDHNATIASNRYADAVKWLNWSSCAALIAAIVTTVYFAIFSGARGSGLWL
jgi:hypothetical protein